MRGVAVALAVLWSMVAPPSEAKPKVVAPPTDARVDWQRGVVVARGAAAGDLRAPSAVIARAGAKRVAMEAARARLRDEVERIAIADGRTFSDGLETKVHERIDRAIAESIVTSETLGSDGSTKVEMAIGIEALRVALSGRDAVRTEGTLIVDARHLAVSPALGYTVVSGDVSRRGPTLFFTNGSRIASDPRIDKGAIRVRAASLDGANLRTGAATGLSRSPLTIILIKKDGATR